MRSGSGLAMLGAVAVFATAGQVHAVEPATQVSDFTEICVLGADVDAALKTATDALSYQPAVPDVPNLLIRERDMAFVMIEDGTCTTILPKVGLDDAVKLATEAFTALDDAELSVSADSVAPETGARQHLFMVMTQPPRMVTAIEMKADGETNTLLQASLK